jgi:hypothetical protein
MPRIAQSPRLWLPLCCFLAAVGLVPLTYRWRQQTPPLSIFELTAQAESKLHLHAVPFAGHGDPQAGIYLCREPGCTRENLPSARQRVFLGEWRGVVVVMPLPTTDEMIGQKLSDWGDAAVVVGNVLLFGDPPLVAEIVRMVVRP